MFEGFSDVASRRIRAAVGDFDMPTSEYWRGVMFRVRKPWMTQGELGDAVGTSQANISDIEAGKVLASKYVPAICEALGIPLPIVFVKDEFDERWLEAGRFLRARSMKRFLNYLEIFEEEAGIEASTDDQPDEVESLPDDEPGRGRRPAERG